MDASLLEPTMEIAKSALVDLDISFVFHLVLFIATTLILNAVVFQPMLKVEQLRHDQTRGAVDEAQQMDADAQERIAKYEEAVAAARRNGNDSFQTLRDDAQKRSAESIAAARADAEQQLDASMGRLQTKYEDGRRELESRAKELATTMADKLLEPGN